MDDNSSHGKEQQPLSRTTAVSLRKERCKPGRASLLINNFPVMELAALADRLMNKTRAPVLVQRARTHTIVITKLLTNYLWWTAIATAYDG